MAAETGMTAVWLGGGALLLGGLGLGWLVMGRLGAEKDAAAQLQVQLAAIQRQQQQMAAPSPPATQAAPPQPQQQGGNPLTQVLGFVGQLPGLIKGGQDLFGGIQSLLS